MPSNTTKAAAEILGGKYGEEVAQLFRDEADDHMRELFAAFATLPDADKLAFHAAVKRMRSELEQKVSHPQSHDL